LPEIIQFKNGNQIRNKYNAAGQKLSSRNITVEAGVYQPLNPGDIILNIDVNENDNVTVEGMDYIGNFEYQIYRFFDWDVTFEPVEYKYLSKIHNPEGYATSATTSNGPIYYYYRRDHLGNNREVWRASYTWGSTTHAAATVQRTQYYPSGLPWKYNSGDNPGSQPYKYNGKEFVEMHGLDEYDSEARWYYPAIMRTTTMDPHAENYYSISPYAWCGNNPTQMTANMTLKDQSFGQAFRNKDWTSAGGSFVVGAVGIPGVTAISKTAKVATIATSVAVDAAVDVSIAEGNQNIFNGEKSLTTASIDAVGSLVGGKASDGIVKRAKNSISNDISSGTFSTLNKTEKNTLRQTQTVVNSQGFEAGTKAVVGLGTETGKQGAKGIVGSGNPSGNTAPLMQNYTQPSDNTRVVRPIYPLPEFK
jgi:RHS repeat-associated protein